MFCAPSSVYDSLFAEKLDLLLKIRETTHVYWSGKHRAALTGQGVYPRPVQNPLPIRIGVGGTPHSFARAGALGIPLVVAIIGGEPRRFRPPHAKTMHAIELLGTQVAPIVKKELVAVTA
jgi:alkanesulfonate monooxygenase SsuD/methylene tetrahydromethanopterin reductase-like flavin-dependent oxidoreductase (luciferase family)